MPKATPRPQATEITLPRPETLRKYGLTLDEWLGILERQGYVCALCKKISSTGRFCTDHDHVKKWKKLPPEERKRHVRGLLCHWCNGKIVGWRVTLEKARNLVVYLEQHFARLERSQPCTDTKSF